LKYLPFLVLIILHFSLSGQDLAVLHGARSLGMGNNMAGLRDEFAVFNNPAGLSYIEKPVILSGYESRFSVKSLNSSGLGVVVPLSVGVAGVSVSKFGDHFLNVERIGIAFGHKIGNFSLGAKINYVQMNIEQLGTRSNISFDFGGMALLTKKLSFAAYITNLNQAAYSKKSHEKIPTFMRTALCFYLIEQLTVQVEIEKSTINNIVYKSGIEYNIIKPVFLRTGVTLNPFQNTFGIGIRPKKWGIDYAISNNNVLGITQQLSLSMKFKNRK
jgi:hypothetical protein